MIPFFLVGTISVPGLGGAAGVTPSLGAVCACTNPSSQTQLEHSGVYLVPDKGLGAPGLHQQGFLNPDSALLSPPEPHAMRWQRDTPEAEHTPEVHAVAVHRVWLRLAELQLKASSHHSLLHLVFLQTEA